MTAITRDACPHLVVRRGQCQSCGQTVTPKPKGVT